MKLHNHVNSLISLNLWEFFFHFKMNTKQTILAPLVTLLPQFQSRAEWTDVAEMWNIVSLPYYRYLGSLW